jgi:hypothetical protein
MPDFTTASNSTRWALFNAVATALETAPELQGVPVHRNPKQAVPLAPGEYALLAFWGRDSLVERKGNDDVRSFDIAVGSMANTEQAARDADAMHQVATNVLRLILPALNGVPGVREVNVREADKGSELEKPLIEGDIVLSTYTLTYRRRAFHISAAT